MTIPPERFRGGSVSNLGESSALGSYPPPNKYMIPFPLGFSQGIPKHPSQNHRLGWVSLNLFWQKYYLPPHGRISLPLEQKNKDCQCHMIFCSPKDERRSNQNHFSFKSFKHSQTISISFRLSVDSCKHGAPCAQHKADFCCHAASMDLRPTLQSPTDQILMVHQFHMLRLGYTLIKT